MNPQERLLRSPLPFETHLNDDLGQVKKYLPRNKRIILRDDDVHMNRMFDLPGMFFQERHVGTMDGETYHRIDVALAASPCFADSTESSSAGHALVLHRVAESLSLGPFRESHFRSRRTQGGPSYPGYPKAAGSRHPANVRLPELELTVALVVGASAKIRRDLESLDLGYGLGGLQVDEVDPRRHGWHTSRAPPCGRMQDPAFEALAGASFHIPCSISGYMRVHTVSPPYGRPSTGRLMQSPMMWHHLQRALAWRIYGAHPLPDCRQHAAARPSPVSPPMGCFRIICGHELVFPFFGACVRASPPCAGSRRHRVVFSFAQDRQSLNLPLVIARPFVPHKPRRRRLRSQKHKAEMQTQHPENEGSVGL